METQRQRLRANPTRRQRRALSFVSCALLSLFAGCGARAGDPTADVATARHLAVLCLDTVRYDAFSLPETAGFADPLTPWLESGLVFDRAQSPAPWTVPAVASLLTGLYPNQHGAGRFDEEIADLSKTVPAAIRGEAETLPELLASSGFSTAAFVAHPWFRTGYGLDRGFATLELKNKASALTRRSLEWLDGRPSTAGERPPDEPPFFVYLHFMEAHERHRQPMEQIDEIVGGMAPEARAAAAALAAGFACQDASSAKCRRFLAYVDTVLELRAEVASFMAGLEERGLLDDTVVVVYSDHGEEFDDHLAEGRAEGLDPRGIYGAGHGHTLYQELLHVPFVIWHPGIEGRNVTAPVSLVDVAPSLLEWLPSPAAAAPSETFPAGRSPSSSRARPTRPARSTRAESPTAPASWPCSTGAGRERTCRDRASLGCSTSKATRGRRSRSTIAAWRCRSTDGSRAISSSRRPHPPARARRSHRSF